MNKRTMKKGLAIVLALVMVFAMTATAFASTNSDITVNVEFYDGQELLMSWPVTINPSAMTEEKWDALYTIPTLQNNQYYNANLLLNSQRPSAMDATLTALIDMGSLGETEVGWDYYLHENTKQNSVVDTYLTFLDPPQKQIIPKQLEAYGLGMHGFIRLPMQMGQKCQICMQQMFLWKMI